jgi:hypothetical protein
MPVNQQDVKDQLVYTPSQEDKDFLSKVVDRLDDLQEYRSALMANPYDVSSKARTLEATWDFDDYIALPHKYSNTEMEDWMCNNSRPMVWSKIQTALSILVSKNPEVEISGRTEKFNKKSKILEALYNCSWDKGDGKRQLIKFIFNILKYGTGIGREYHRYVEIEKEVVTGYDPQKLRHVTEKRKVAIHDEPYFEVLPIRSVWIDNRAKPYDRSSVRDWSWCIDYDFSTFEILYKDLPNAKFVKPSTSSENADVNDKALLDDVIGKPRVRVYFYENEENNEFVIFTKDVLIYKGVLVNGRLSLVLGMWQIRNEYTIYGIGLPEILENSQELYDKLSNMTTNQLLLAISGSGFYGGQGDLSEKDLELKPKLTKLRDAEKIIFPKIPMPDSMVLEAIEGVKIEADEISGVTKSLSGEIVGKTLGEAVLNKEAGLQRLSLPLQNIEFALEDHARLRIDNIQYIYSTPVKSDLIRNKLGEIIEPQLWEEYLAERGQQTQGLAYKYPEDLQTGELYKNTYRSERMKLEKTPEGETQPTEQDQYLEITPEEISGEYDVKIKAFSTLPMSKTLEASKALETLNIFAKLPYVDLYALEKWVMEKRGDPSEKLLQTEEQIIQEQQQADQARQQEAMMQAQQAEQEEAMGHAELAEKKANTVVSATELEQPASRGGISGQINQAVKI